MAGILKTHLQRHRKGDTGHAEVIQLEYDADELSFDELLLIFFKTITHHLKQAGRRYWYAIRSAIFYHNDDQKQQALAMIKRLTDERFRQPYCNEVTPASEFYKAEDYHKITLPITRKPVLVQPLYNQSCTNLQRNSLKRSGRITLSRFVRELLLPVL